MSSASPTDRAPRHHSACATGVAAALVVYATAVRPRLLHAGSTEAERTATYPGDDLVPGARPGSTMATTIAAPPSAVWAWLVQMGADRGGFYSFDRLDNGGRPSVRELRPQWQHLGIGDRIAAVPDASVWFDVALLDPERTLVLRSSLALPRARHFDPAGPPPRVFSDSIWAFHLRRTDNGQTRLVVRGAGRGRPSVVTRLADWIFWEPAHWIMQIRQFQGLKGRAETQAP